MINDYDDVMVHVKFSVHMDSTFNILCRRIMRLGSEPIFFSVSLK